MDPLGCLIKIGSNTTTTTKNALVVLNDPYPKPELMQTLVPLWNLSDLVVIADGAANFVYDLLIRNRGEGGSDTSGPKSTKQFLPHAICGDWDSIRPDVEQYFRSQNTVLIKDTSQDENDLWKCLKEVQNRQNSTTQAQSTGQDTSLQSEKFAVYVYCSLGGRLDHSMQSLNALFCWQDVFKSLSIINNYSTATLLQPGETTLTLRPPYEGPIVGLLPIGQPVRSLTTRGLKWDVNDWPTRMGSVISTSNRINVDENELYNQPTNLSQSRTIDVYVKTSDPIVWVSSINSDKFSKLVQ